MIKATHNESLDPFDTRDRAPIVQDSTMTVSSAVHDQSVPMIALSPRVRREQTHNRQGQPHPIAANLIMLSVVIR
jgi:hypothetical protein